MTDVLQKYNSTYYKISFEDYRQAIKLGSSKINLRIYFGFVLIVFLLSALTIDIVITRPRKIPPVTVIMSGIMIMYIVLIAWYWLRSRKVLLKHYLSQKALQENIALSLDEKGVCFKRINAEQLLVWDEIVKWKENELCLLLYCSNTLFHMIPKKVEESGFPLNILRDKLKEKVGRPE